MSDTKMVAIAYGFYYFGTEVQAPDGYIALKSAAMSGGYSGGKGIAGVCRGDKQSKITLDRFEEDEELLFPTTAVLAIMPSIDLYSFKGTTIR